MATASTTAWVLHDLGLAAGFGGSLFGQMALNPAVKQVSSKRERGQVLDKAWGGFRLVHGISLALSAVSWIAGRSLVSGRFVGRDLRRLVVAKDVLVGATVASGIASSVAGSMLSEEHARAPLALESGARTSAGSERVQTLNTVVKAAGIVNIAAMAAAIGVTTVLAMKAGRSAKWSAFARILP